MKGGCLCKGWGTRNSVRSNKGSGKEEAKGGSLCSLCYSRPRPCGGTPAKDFEQPHIQLVGATMWGNNVWGREATIRGMGWVVKERSSAQRGHIFIKTGRDGQCMRLRSSLGHWCWAGSCHRRAEHWDSQSTGDSARTKKVERVCRTEVGEDFIFIMDSFAIR